MTWVFQSTQPEWAATKQLVRHGMAIIISIHAARVGCDFLLLCLLAFRLLFQSTQPEWAATAARLTKTPNSLNFNPRSPSGLRPPAYYSLRLYKIISIHAARVGCDSNSYSFILSTSDISIHAARVGCDLLFASGSAVLTRFQSTQPEWAATLPVFQKVLACRYFNPRSPSGLRLTAAQLVAEFGYISIHAARVGCDCIA